MHSHLVSQITMCYFHLVAVCLLLTCLASASDVIISPCKDFKSASHQYVVNITRFSEDTLKISLDDENCNAQNFKLSLVIGKWSIVCNDISSSLDVVYTTSQGGVLNETNWGCPGKSDYHLGDLYMYVDHIIDDAKEFTISKQGDWSNSSTKIGLVAAVYYDPEYNECGKDYFDCFNDNICVNSNVNKMGRCISKSLKCDDYPSCGLRCNVDEANEICHNGYWTFAWGDFQYIVTTFLAALFFILSPTVIVFLLFYRKRMRVQEYQRRIQLEREVRAARERSMVVTISNRLNDNPPTYDDVHETKEPPPCFCAAVALSNMINQDKAAEAESQSQGTSESSTEIKYDCTCKV